MISRSSSQQLCDVVTMLPSFQVPPIVIWVNPKTQLAFLCLLPPYSWRWLIPAPTCSMLDLFAAL